MIYDEVMRFYGKEDESITCIHIEVGKVRIIEYVLLFI